MHVLPSRAIVFFFFSHYCEYFVRVTWMTFSQPLVRTRGLVYFPSLSRNQNNANVHERLRRFYMQWSSGTGSPLHNDVVHSSDPTETGRVNIFRRQRADSDVSQRIKVASYNNWVTWNRSHHWPREPIFIVLVVLCLFSLFSLNACHLGKRVQMDANLHKRTIRAAVVRRLFFRANCFFFFF